MRGAFTGSFDPITIGHVNIIERAAKLFDELIVVLLINPSKEMKYSKEERFEMARLATARIPNVKVADYDGMTVDFCLKNNVDGIVRGIRNSVDIAYEVEMADYNRKNGVETMFLTAEEQLVKVSSSRAVTNEEYIPKECLDYIKARLKNYRK